MNLYAIRDKIRAECQPPFTAKNDQEGLRIIGISLSKDPYAIQHADEFELWWLGHWDPETGVIETGSKPSIVTPNINTEEV